MFYFGYKKITMCASEEGIMYACKDFFCIALRNNCNLFMANKISFAKTQI